MAARGVGHCAARSLTRPDPLRGARISIVPFRYQRPDIQRHLAALSERFQFVERLQMALLRKLFLIFLILIKLMNLVFVYYKINIIN